MTTGFALAAIPPREDARDAFVSANFEGIAALPPCARIGTSSLRREAQLRAVRSDLQVISLRGNVDTRLRKLEAGEFDAIILATAGLLRLGRLDAIRAKLEVGEMCPAAGQGALAIEIRDDDSVTRAALNFLDDPSTRKAVACERAMLNALGGGCQVPIGAHATIHSGALNLTAIVARPDGSRLLRVVESGIDPEKVGAKAARKLLDQGARAILEQVYKTGAVVPEQP